MYFYSSFTFFTSNVQIMYVAITVTHLNYVIHVTLFGDYTAFFYRWLKAQAKVSFL